MGSRIRSSCERVFDVFCEVGIPTQEEEIPFILTKFPDDYNDREILKSIPHFSYPVPIEAEAVVHFTFVLTTGADSKWTFGYVRHSKVPTRTCLVMLSSLPWPHTFMKILNFISDLTNRAEALHSEKFLDALYHMAVPDPGLRLSISYCVNNKEYPFEEPCPDHLKIQSIKEDKRLAEYIAASSTDTMIQVFCSMLNERRIIITCKKLERLTSCVQAANSLIYPMFWQHIFIPVLPMRSPYIDFLSAPMPYLIGVPAETMKRVNMSELGDVVIIDFDENRITSPYDDVHMLPNDVISFLRKGLKTKPEEGYGDHLPRTFLKALVKLIGGYRDALTFTPGHKISFNPDAFVSSRPTAMQPFLDRMLQLQLFQQFIEGRLAMLNDGKGFNDEFEMEINLIEDKSGHKLKVQYNDWIGGIKKDGAAVIKSMNPAVKSAYRSVKESGKTVKDKGKKAMKDIKNKLGTKSGGHTMHHNSPANMDNGFRSAPSSPSSSPTSARRQYLQIKEGGSAGNNSAVLSNSSSSSSVSTPSSTGIQTTVSGMIVEKTPKTATYVRGRDRPSTTHATASSTNPFEDSPPEVDLIGAVDDYFSTKFNLKENEPHFSGHHMNGTGSDRSSNGSAHKMVHPQPSLDLIKLESPGETLMNDALMFDPLMSSSGTRLHHPVSSFDPLLTHMDPMRSSPSNGFGPSPFSPPASNTNTNSQQFPVFHPRPSGRTTPTSITLPGLLPIPPSSIRSNRSRLVSPTTTNPSQLASHGFSNQDLLNLFHSPSGEATNLPPSVSPFLALNNNHLVTSPVIKSSTPGTSNASTHASPMSTSGHEWQKFE